MNLPVYIKNDYYILSIRDIRSIKNFHENIALFPKYKQESAKAQIKLIEGKLDDVKRQHRTNIYQVGILTNNIEGLMVSLTQKFTIGQTNFKSLNDDLKLEVHLENHSSNELISILTQFGQVTHFMEKIPTVNDILIQTVSQ